ncbi:unnamed protein product, partial [Ectocarpus fasciculatus]
GATSVIIRPLFVLEDVVLYVFVVVRSFFVWSFSGAYSVAMNVHGLSNLPRPLSSSPRIAAGSSSSPPSPASLARAAPRAPGNRNAWSTLVRIVEGIIAICVCVFVLDGSGVNINIPSSLATTLLGFTLSLFLCFSL